MRIRPGQLEHKFHRRAGHECGAIRGNTVAVMVDKRPSENLSHIYRPADLYLNGECADADCYDIEQSNLVAM
jgi:hypothetical protein